LRSAAARWTVEHGLPVSFAADGLPPPLISPQDVALFRVAEEAVANAARHANASRVDLRLRGWEGALELEIVDDGRGFDPTSTIALSLVAMRERLSAMGGQLEIVSGPGQGTRIAARVPVASGLVGAGVEKSPR
jgi:signal transduction histidine kinase